GPAGGNGPLTAAYAGSSQDGGRVFFETLERLVPADTDNRNDVYEHANGATSLVSTSPTGGNDTVDAFFYAASADGAVVLFGTSERLTAGDTDSASDVYERANGATSLVSAGTSGGNGPQGAFFDGLAADGARVFFHTTERLVSGDTDSQADVYERFAGATALVSTGSSGGNGAFPAFFDGASADGTRVFFDTDERLISGDTDSMQDVYERTGGATALLSIGPDGGNGPFPAFFDAASEDGTRVILATDEILTEPDADGQFDVYQRDGGTMKVLSATDDMGGDGFDALYTGSSRDGLRVFFETAEPLAGGDSDAQVDVFERSGATIARRSGGNGASDALFAGAAADGSHVLYESEEQVLAADTDAEVDVYDSAGTTALVSTGPAGGNGALDAFFADVSDDGARAFFTTAESIVAGDTDSSADLYERAAGATSVVSAGPTGGNGPFNVSFAAASSDGTTAIFTTTESLATGDADSSADVYAALVRTGHARPRAASPLRVSLVPAYQPCESPNRTHGPPLAFGSCAPPQQSSQDLTVGTPDANGQPARSIGSLRLSTVVGDPSTPEDEADVRVSLSITDVRRLGDVSDYAGEVTAALSVRLTDRDGPATVTDLTFDVVGQCAATSTDDGGSCSATTTFDAITPGAVVEGARAIWQLDAVEVADGSGGAFARQGIFVP
ncbi:MAG: hypothetical protein ACRDLQ_10095, partial [Solirubrobacterales bacterium]